MKIPKFLSDFAGRSILHKYPFWFLYKPVQHKIKGHEIRQILNVIKKGDILLSRHDSYISSFFIPGYWSHAALYDGENNIYQSTGSGVGSEDILDFCRTDNIVVFRIKTSSEKMVNNAITLAKELVSQNIGYDYDFKSGNDELYCSEFVDVCYGNLFRSEYSKTKIGKVLLPNKLYGSPKLIKIIEFSHGG